MSSRPSVVPISLRLLVRNLLGASTRWSRPQATAEPRQRRVAVSGDGNIGLRHLQAYQEIPNATVLGLPTPHSDHLDGARHVRVFVLVPQISAAARYEPISRYADSMSVRSLTD